MAKGQGNGEVGFWIEMPGDTGSGITDVTGQVFDFIHETFTPIAKLRAWL